MAMDMEIKKKLLEELMSAMEDEDGAKIKMLKIQKVSPEDMEGDDPRPSDMDTEKAVSSNWIGTKPMKVPSPTPTPSPSQTQTPKPEVENVEDVDKKLIEDILKRRRGM